MVKFVTRFTILGEIARDKQIGENIETKFNLLTDMGL